MVILMTLLGGRLMAQAGALDLSFNPGTGANGDVHAMAIQPDGKILIGGAFTTYNGTARPRIARLNTDGSLDLSFNPGAGCNASVNAIAIQTDGKIVLGGTFNQYDGNARNRMVRILSNGSIDPSFVIGTGFSGGAVYSISIQTNGFFVVGGTFTSFNGTGRNRILRLNASGGLDTSFNPGFGADNNLWTTAIQPDGKILVGGMFTYFNGISRNRIARLNANGSLDATFSIWSGFDATVFTLAIQSNGSIIVGGQFTSYGSAAWNRIARLNSNGTLDGAFNPGSGFSNGIHTIAIQNDGKYVAGGAFTAFDGTNRGFIARINANGSLDGTFVPTGTGFNSAVNAISLQADAKIVAGGAFATFNGTSRNRIARLLFREECDIATCVGRTLTFTPSATNGLAYAWNFGDNTTSSQQAPAHTYGTVGTYTVNLQLTDANGCLSTRTQKVCVFPKVTLNAISVNPTCSNVNNGTIDLNVSGGAPGTALAYQWSSGQTTQDINGLSAGIYTVTVTDLTTGCSQTLSTTITAPITTKYAIRGPSGFCEGGSLVLDAGLGYSSYLWSTGATMQTITVTAAGTYAVTVTTAAGCPFTASRTVTVYPLPTVSITFAPSGCTGISGTLSATAGYASYVWSTGATTQTINVSPKGPYSVTVTDVNGCTNSTSINLNPSSSCPTPVGLAVTSITSTSAVLNWIAVPCAASYAIEYLKVGAAPPGTTVTVAVPATSVTVTGLSPSTNYQWRIKAVCEQGPSSPWSPYVPFATPTLKTAAPSAEGAQPSATLFPNPNRGQFTVVYPATAAGEVEVCVWDMNGKRVFCENKTAAEGENTWEMHFNLASGVYFFRIEPLTQGKAEAKRIRFVVE